MIFARDVFVRVVVCLLLAAVAWADWTVVLPEGYRSDEAVRAVIDDLIAAGTAHGITIEVAYESDSPEGDLVVVGWPDRNSRTRALRDSGQLSLREGAPPEGYEIVTLQQDGRTTMVVAGGSVTGDVYGLYWVWDRLRVHGTIPDINVQRAPKLEIRFTRSVVESEDEIRRALRYGLNTIFGENPLNLIPWNAEAEKSENEAHRARTRELAAYAHALHMKYIAFGTDFTYHPSLLDEFRAPLNTEDPHFWDAVQAKYRRLFQAMPELDGVCTFTADEQRYWGNYRTFDVLHGGASGLALANRYRTFITKLWDVVVGENDKMLLAHTWATNMVEQQAQPQVYRQIFTDAVPTRNLYLFPSFTQNDRWWFQAYNPTINQTPHSTMVVCETMDYHAGGDLFPTYPGPYFQAGLQTMLDRAWTNLKGISLDLPSVDDWQTRSLTAYTVSRLAWDHHEDTRGIAKDFVSIHFGPEVAGAMADVLMLSPVAYAYGLYIEPATYGQFNSLPHIRVGQFVAHGYPEIDGGKEHIEFLRELYLRCKPWIPETLMYLDHGLRTADAMVETVTGTRGQWKDADLERQVCESVELTRHLVRTNNHYVRAMFAYFAYREDRSEEKRQRLEAEQAALTDARNAFAAAPGFGYQLFGVDQLLLNIQHMLRDPAAAERLLADAPGADDIEGMALREQALYEKALEERRDAVKFLHWRGKVDGDDILRVCGADATLEHLRWDSPQVERCEVLAELPKEPVTVIPKVIASRPFHPFVLEQPSADNGYVVSIYLNDIPGGGDWWEFELYYLPCAPAEFGLQVTLKAQH